MSSLIKTGLLLRYCIQMLFAPPKNHVDILLVILFLSKAHFTREQFSKGPLLIVACCKILQNAPRVKGQ